MNPYYMAAIGGVFSFVLLLVTNLIGLKVIRASYKLHYIFGIGTLLFASMHAIFGWLNSGPDKLPSLIMGTVMVLLIFINVLSGFGKIKLSVKTHRVTGLLILALGLLHGGAGLYERFFK